MTSDLKSATLSTLVSMCILPSMAFKTMAASKPPQRSYDLNLKSATLITLVSMCIMPSTASEAMAASKQPRWSYDLRFEINILEYPSIHVHIVSNDLRGHGGLQTTSEVI